MTVRDIRTIRLSRTPTLDTLAVTRAPAPHPAPGEVVVAVRASSLNFHDYLVAAGFIPVAEGRVPMSDGAGEVVALGEGVAGWAIGDRVMGAFFTHWRDGPPTPYNNRAIAGETADGFASEQVAVPAASLTRMPQGWTFEEAATLPCAGLTAWRFLTVEGQLGAGGSVLLPGSGGLCIFALQLAKALGLTVWSTSSSAAKLEQLRALGANHAINYREHPDWGDRVRSDTQGEGVELVLDIGGRSSIAQSVRACRMGGKVVVVGSTGNGAPELPLSEMVMRHIRVDGMAVGSALHLHALVAFVEAHRIRPVIDRVFALEDLAEAFRCQLTGQHFGKIVITF